MQLIIAHYRTIGNGFHAFIAALVRNQTIRGVDVRRLAWEVLEIFFPGIARIEVIAMTTVRFKSHVRVIGVLVAALGLGACDKASDSDKKDDGAIETNLVPVPCKEDKDCGGDIECGKDGFCEVDEMTVDGGAGVSSGAPAPCTTDADCGDDVKCVALSEDGPKFCDVEEMVVSSGAAAPCNTDADCGTAQCVEREFGKFCDVDEMVVGP